MDECYIFYNIYDYDDDNGDYNTSQAHRSTPMSSNSPSHSTRTDALSPHTSRAIRVLPH